jgi:glycosyltransferase involved in cell wall biosynthesis
VSIVTTVIVPFHRDVAMLRRVLEPFRRRSATTELLIAVDGAIEEWQPLAREFGTAHVAWPIACGPAVARNRAASVARGTYLLFVDADVVAEPGVVARVERFFEDHPEAVAVFGAYDDAPEAPGFISQYRNLQHRYVHVSGRGNARTFWAGIGAVRTEVFRAVGGYDERFRRPSVEDIDLGYRITGAGGRIVIDPGLNGKHLKRWTWRSSVVSDVRDRGVPWTQLIQRYGLSPDLNLAWGLRASVVCAYFAVLLAVVSPWAAWARWLLPVPGVLLLVFNRQYYGYFLRTRGFGFAAGAVVAHFVHHLCNGVSYVAGRTLCALQRRFGVETAWTLPRDPAAAVPIRRWSTDGAPTR